MAPGRLSGKPTFRTKREQHGGGDYDVAISHGSRLVKIPQHKLVVKAVDSLIATTVPKVYEMTVRCLEEEERSVESKSPQHSPEVQEVLEEYEDCFVEKKSLGVIQGAVHRIETKDENPVTSRPYRMSWKEQKQLKMELDQLLSAGLIRPSDGVWSSPVLLIHDKIPHRLGYTIDSLMSISPRSAISAKRKTRTILSICWLPEEMASVEPSTTRISPLREARVPGYGMEDTPSNGR